MTFTNPLWLLLLLILPLLVYAYRNQLHGAIKKVSSVMIYKKLSQRVVVKKKIKLPLRFFLEIAALSLLVLALAEYRVANRSVDPSAGQYASLSAVARSAKAEARSEGGNVQAEVDKNILVVSPFTKNELGLDKIKNLNFEVTSSDSSVGLSAVARPVRRSVSEGGSAKADLLIFHRSAPPLAEKIPTLFVLPPQENPVFPLVTGKDGKVLQIKSPKITSSDSSHPITSYLRLGLLSPKSSLVFGTPRWAEAVISTERGAIVVAGESNGVRFAAVGFEIFPFDGAGTPLESILLFNLIDWLGNKGGVAGGDTDVAKKTITDLLTPRAAGDAGATMLWQALAMLALVILAVDLGLRVRQ